MYTEPVGVSILTNGERCGTLQLCISSLLHGCAYRPLVIGIFNNGSTDDTESYLTHGLPKAHGIVWRTGHATTDLGCSQGTNGAIALVDDCEYALHLESDFIHCTERETGVDRNWMGRALAFMGTGVCDYLYLRRMRDENEMAAHFWSQWMPRVIRAEGEYLCCPRFWWSQNPHLRRNEALRMSGTIPVPEMPADYKGSPTWNQSEMCVPPPPNTWIHRWGMFFHDDPMMGFPEALGWCGKFGPFGLSTCKYGFYKEQSFWCEHCRMETDFRDMENHERRVRAALAAGEAIK